MKNTLEIVNNILSYRSQDKLILDKYLDSGLFALMANGAYVLGLDKTIDFVSRSLDNYEGLAIMGIYTGFGMAFTSFNDKLVFPISKKIAEFQNDRFSLGEDVSLLSFGRTLSQIAGAGLLYSVLNVGGSLENIRYDGERVIAAFAREGNNLENLISEEEKRDSVIEDSRFSFPDNLDLSSIGNYSLYSDKGRFLRTYRWDETISKMENKYGIEKGLIAGLIMRESMGNPLQLNSGNDGGAGLMMFQPGTAVQYGLNIYGDSRKTGRDRNHDFKLKKLVKNNNFDLSKLSKKDERFDTVKSIDAGSHYISDLFNKYGSFDKALSAYNRGTPARNPLSTNHVKEVRRYQKIYLNNKKKLGSENLVFNNRKNKLPKTNLNDSDFTYFKKNSKGIPLFTYHVKSGDNATTIAQKFNEFDEKINGNKYVDIQSENILKPNGVEVGSNIKLGEKVYIKAPKV